MDIDAAMVFADPDQARIAGRIFDQDAVFDFQRGDLNLNHDQYDMAIASQLWDAADNPNSNFRKMAASVRKSLKDLREKDWPSEMTDFDADEYMDAATRIAWMAHRANPERFPTFDSAFNWRVKAGQKLDARTAMDTLTRTVLKQEPGPALQAALKKVKGVGKAMKWYYESHDYIERADTTAGTGRLPPVEPPETQKPGR